MPFSRIPIRVGILGSWFVLATVMADSGVVKLRPEGMMQERFQANLEQWLLPAPEANPGILQMFKARDRHPTPEIVPWAGEFVGKYLCSAVPVMKLTDDPRLKERIADVVAGVVAAQAEDGYLGPFPKKERLLGHWDLWGHYHVMTGLLDWYNATGDQAALAAARKIGDLICHTYIDQGRSVLKAGDPEMNMAIVHSLGRLHRLTGDARHRAQAEATAKDWEQAGDYFRAGIDGREFYQSPRPRWESLHDLQGLLELWRMTADVRYRTAFEHHWRSIRRWDRRNTGGFSSGEQATGDPYAPSAIETCCTVAWLALTKDYWLLTGDAQAADDLELGTLNAGLGAQHPSGRWWTYSTPMDGIREASAHSIVFQSRAGTPELNCCSVNGPRIFGLLTEWAITTDGEEVTVNWLGAGSMTAKRSDGSLVTVRVEGDLWVQGKGGLRVTGLSGKEFALRVRIPKWVADASVLVNGASVESVVPGTYAEIRRAWSEKDEVKLSWSIPVRSVAGGGQAAGKVSLYRGPFLLAWDQAFNEADEDRLEPVRLTELGQSSLAVIPKPRFLHERRLVPNLLVDVPAGNAALHLVDFTSAGSRGTRYRSWLAAEGGSPVPVQTQYPRDGASIPPGQVTFQWQRTKSQGPVELEVAGDSAFKNIALKAAATGTNRAVLDLAKFAADTKLYWRVATVGAQGRILPDAPAAWFRVDPAAPAQALPEVAKLGPRGEIFLHDLKGGAPRYGKIIESKISTTSFEGSSTDGLGRRIVFETGTWPSEEYTLVGRVRIDRMPDGHPGQIFSAWAAPMDDPLRLVVEKGKLYARIEAGGGFSTPGVPVQTARWYRIAAVKSGPELRLYVDGSEVGRCAAPAEVISHATDAALGANPHYGGNEYLAATFADFGLYGRALEPGELK